MKNFLKILSVYVGASFFLAQRACVAYIWLLFKYAIICIPNTERHIRITLNYWQVQAGGGGVKSVIYLLCITLFL